jgi:diguanylate cyclase (GGDEF)-like protein/PAS domain S-box-containing protein
VGNAADLSSPALPARRDGADVRQKAAPRTFFLSVPNLAAALLVSTGTLVISGWVLDISVLKSLSASWPTMKVNAAVCFVLCGIALHALGNWPKDGPSDGSSDARIRLAGSAAAAAMAGIGLLTLAQHLWGTNFQIDELLMQQRSTPADTARPGRMSAAAATGFLLLGSAFLSQCFGRRTGRTVAVILALLVGVISVGVILGYSHDLEVLFSIRPVSSMALHTAVLFGVAASGTLAARPALGWTIKSRVAAAAAAEEAFRRRVLFEKAHDGIVVFDAERNIYEANASFARLLGYTIEEVADLHPWDWDVKYHTRELFLKEWPEVPQSSGEIDAQFRSRDDSVIDVAISYTPAQFDGTTYLYCICRDVTEQRTAERTRHESEERFRRALANIPDVVVIYGPDLRIRYINNATRRITGLRNMDFIGRRDAEIFPPEVYQAYLPALEDALQSKLIRKVEADVILPGTGLRSLRVTCVPLLDREGEVREVLGITQDLTERRSAEKRIRQSEEQYRELIEQAADGIFISDADGKFVLVNSRCCELLGYERDELLGMNGSQTYLSEETSATTRRMALLEAGQDLRYERMLKRKDGSSFPAEISVKMLDSGGMQVIFHDITKRHMQERKIARLIRIHAVMSGINAAIVRVRDRRALLNEACRIAVDAGKFEMAWIGTAGPGQNKARILAQSGLPTEVLSGDEDKDPVVDLMPNGPVSFSLQEKRPVYENDIAKSPHLSKMRRLAVRQGAKSVISLPLVVDGQVFGFLVLYASERNFFDDEELKLLQELARDISFALEFIAKGEQVNYLAYYDSLTGLPNRTRFFEALNRQLANAEAAGDGVMLQLFDIDRFRMINDTYGRDRADRLIGEIAERVRSSARATDTVARVGPDSFAIAMTGACGAAQAAHAPELLNERVFGRPFLMNQDELPVSATSGVAVFPGDGTNANSLLSNAEMALRVAEKQNLKILFYRSDMNERQ